MDTDQLIAELTEDSAPVKRLPPPWRRALTWLAVSTFSAIVIVAVIGLRTGLSMELSDPRFFVEQAATLATAIFAAFAAFQAVVPGRPRWLLWLPLLPLAVWLASLGVGCLEELRLYGEFILRPHWTCGPSIVLIGAVPAILMAVMLRRGAPLYPRLAVAYGGLASAAIGNLGLWTFHEPDAGLMVLLWHMGTVAVVAGLAGAIAPKWHNWRTAGR